MATALPRPRADSHLLRGLLFAIWAAVVLAAYFSYHPLPMRDGVPVWRGALTAAAMLVITWPLWRRASISRGPQVEHLVLLPVLLTAALVMLPETMASFSWQIGAVILTPVWVFTTIQLRRYFGATGFLLGLLAWFPGSFALLSVLQWGLTVAILALLALALMLRRPANITVHRYVARATIAGWALGLALALAGVQRHCHPVGFLSGAMSAPAWLEAYATELSEGCWMLKP